jgi:hypothetical protein
MSAVWKRVPNDIQAFGLLRGAGIGARNGFSPLAVRGRAAQRGSNRRRLKMIA